MEPKDQDTNASNDSQSEHSASNPMMMGMMKKMMDQMGSGGEDPMAMMQKMMGQMGSQPSGEASNPMQQMMGMCMGMCSEMLTAIHRTNSMAVFSTPELHTLFGEWMESLERQALAALDEQVETDAAALSTKLNISEASAIHLMAHLAGKGKVSLSVRATGKGEP
ncbi:hypothetical protein M8009_01490 [Halomonas sp. ATCH28]|uniref:MarR family transcriptional regulator n=1 Tax=Halomonas gemina TaxID=2945105 RepID=A0ABT0SWM1_9GAMM|nr:hypothetical protein [Halomonas gemina]MCL7938978.1 hypothetical protein [Halomonas gemina]